MDRNGGSDRVWALATSQQLLSSLTSGLRECITPLWPMFTMHCLDSELKASAVYRMAS